MGRWMDGWMAAVRVRCGTSAGGCHNYWVSVRRHNGRVRRRRKDKGKTNFGQPGPSRGQFPVKVDVL